MGSVAHLLSSIRRTLAPSRTQQQEAAGEKPAAWYDAKYADSASHASHYTESMYYFLWTVIADRIPSDAAILEIGCGTGHFAHFLHDQGLNRYLGFDFSAEAIRIAKLRLPAGHFEHADALTTPLLNGSYDTAICTEVLEHIEDDIRVIERIRPQTRCLLTVPNFTYISHVRHFVSKREVSDRYGRFFTTHDISWFLLKKSGDGFFLLDGVRSST